MTPDIVGPVRHCVPPFLLNVTPLRLRSGVNSGPSAFLPSYLSLLTVESSEEVFFTSLVSLTDEGCPKSTSGVHLTEQVGNLPLTCLEASEGLAAESSVAEVTPLMASPLDPKYVIGFIAEG